MINWLWIIPWVMVAVFALGWRFGGKATERRVIERYDRQECLRREQEMTFDQCHHLQKQIDNLERRYYKRWQKSVATTLSEEENEDG